MASGSSISEFAKKCALVTGAGKGECMQNDRMKAPGKFSCELSSADKVVEYCRSYAAGISRL